MWQAPAVDGELPRASDLERTRMKAFLCLCLVLLSAACSREAEPPATATTIVISEAETERMPRVVVKRFEISPDPARRGRPISATAEIEPTHPARTVSVNWYGPDGWLAGYDVHETTEPRITSRAPVGPSGDPGRYRAVLRAGPISLAEDEVTVTE